MVHDWASFVRDGRSRADDSARWPAFETGDRFPSLRAGGDSTPITEAAFAAEHHRDSWGT